ncbi:MAG: DUF4118 domain-containing protein [Burkholderiales bacterium]|nr:DUF4118 domain-containing protein [Burkholderiales bacterium]
MSSILDLHPVRWALVLLLLAAATAFGLLIDSYVSLTSQAMLYVLVVEIASYRLGRLEAAICAVGAVAALNFFFVPPRWTFAVDQREHLIVLAVMLFVAFMTSRLAAGLQREARAARLSEGRARQLQELATRLSAAGTVQEIRTIGQAALQAAFGAGAVLTLADEGNRVPDAAQGICLPLGEQGRVFGMAEIPAAAVPDQEGLEHGRTLAALLAQALWRLELDEAVLAARSEAQRHELLNTFLASISHDLRTPLATILGASSSLQTQRDLLSPAQQSRMLGSIATEARYLTVLTENTLQLARLSDPVVELHRDWESVEEIVGAVLARVRPQDPGRRIRSVVPAGLPLLRVDPVLLGQLLVNLLDNALKYSEGCIEIQALLEPGRIDLCVSDRGPGIPVAQRESVFSPYSRNDRSGQRGAGLGLAVCRAIAIAHGGTLAVEDREGCGCRFCLSLPIEPQQPLAEQP